MRLKLKSFVFAFTLLAFMGGLAQPSLAQTPTGADGFQQWVESFKKRALADGLAPSTIEQSLNNISFLPRVIELDRKQPEKTITFTEYKKRILSEWRIDNGQKMFREHYDLLKEIGNVYGVAPHYIVALWGIETNYGNFTGGTQTVDALATLAYEGRRAEFFETELLNALRIIEQGHIDATEMKGSWAGALGQNQFMPSSFLAYAVDYNQNGRKNIWTELPDVFASSANYLAKHGWKGDERWGRKVKLPDNFSDELISKDVRKSVSKWAELGVKTAWGHPLPNNESVMGYIVAPDGQIGPTYLVYNNFDVFKRWNRSTYFATTVGLLADKIVR